MRCASLITLLLLACSTSTDTIETAHDAGGDAERDASEEAGFDAGPRLHRCSVEGCNGEIDAIGSAAGCPSEPPALAMDCALEHGASCFYCEPREEQLAIGFSYPAYVCEEGTWVFEELVSACD